jgi:type IX secretion system PorP/SprF family membrane protein
MKKGVVIAALLVAVFHTNANAQQDQHFSMFTESQLYMNPAVAGFTQGDMQLFTNYRLQWSTVSDNPYQTISASSDWRMFDRGGNYMGAGVTFYNDVAGVPQYTTNVIALPFNYTLRVDRNNLISFGLQPAWYQRVIKNQEMNWFNQWTGVAYDQGIDNGELLLSQNFNISRFDIGTGFYWDSYISRTAKLRLGIAGHHLTKQRINLTEDDDRLYRKLVIHGQGEFLMEESGVTILPAFSAFLQGPNKEINFGSNFRFLLKSGSRATSYFEEITFSTGAYFRWGDAIVVNAILDLSGFSFGASYDLNVSGLNVATKGVGSMEFFLRYRIQFGTRNLRNNRVH